MIDCVAWRIRPDESVLGIRKGSVVATTQCSSFLFAAKVKRKLRSLYDYFHEISTTTQPSHRRPSANELAQPKMGMPIEPVKFVPINMQWVSCGYFFRSIFEVRIRFDCIRIPD